MILSDIDLTKRLTELEIVGPNPNFPFTPESQVQSCSIDLRLSEVVWKPNPRARVNLAEGDPLGPAVERAFTRKRISYPKGFRLAPGQFLLCRTYERFSLPADLMGRLVGRSSFGRLGLSIAAQSNLINPGWSGHMPLIIVNNSPFEIVLQPYIGVVQLCLFPLSTSAMKPYGSEGAGSKYINDDGGPSRYWLDRTIAELRQNAQGHKVSPEVQEFLTRFSGELDEPTRRRFAAFVQKGGTITEVTPLLDEFAAAQQRRGVLVVVGSLLVSVPLAVLVSWLPALWGQGWWARALALMVAALAVIGITWLGWTYQGNTMSASELRRAGADLRKELRRKGS